MELAAMASDLLEEHGVPGAVVAVADADGARVVTAGSRGDGRGSVDDDTVFRGASLSKPAFACGVMALVNAGALELDRTPIACIGLERNGRGEAEVTALAVLSEWRRQGFARTLIFGACEYLAVRALEAETDADAVDFYRALGFEVETLGELYPGVERFRCRLELPIR